MSVFARLELAICPAILLLLVALSPGPALGQEEESEETPQQSAVTTSLSKLTVHGFLTQAYAEANFSDPFTLPGLSNPTADEIVLGIPEGGTTDYRTMAIQFRYQISPRDIMIVQFSSRSLGTSPTEDLEDEVELDWAFYERRIGDSTSVKVGRVQIPLGIFNEIRDVGTILPFYRPPFAFYREGAFTSETVDGLVLSHRFLPESDWSIDADVYYGEYNVIEFGDFAQGQAARIARAEDVTGVQLWFNTPLLGLRFGLGGHRRDLTGGQEGTFRPIGYTEQFDDWYASIDLALERVVFRSEYRTFGADPNPIFFGGDFPLWYVQIGYHFNEQIRVYAQYEEASVENEREDFAILPLPVTDGIDIKLRTDTGIALNYLFSTNLVLKLEHHFDVDNELFSFAPEFTPTGPVLRPVYETSEGGEYTILSLSASF